MSATFTLLFFKQFALPRTQGGLVAAMAYVPGLWRAEGVAGGLVLAESSVPGLCKLDIHHSGLQHAEGATSGLANVDVFHSGVFQLETHHSGLHAARIDAPGFSQAESNLSGLVASDSNTPGFTLATQHAPGFVQAGTFQEVVTMPAPQVFSMTFREDGTATVLGRLTWRSGTGDPTGVDGEGNFAKQVDFTGGSITYKVFDATDGTETGTGSVTVASAVLDTPVMTRALWTIDAYGYNFLHDLPPSCFPTGTRDYQVEYKFTFAGGAVGWGQGKGPALAVLTS